MWLSACWFSSFLCMFSTSSIAIAKEFATLAPTHPSSKICAFFVTNRPFSQILQSKIRDRVPVLQIALTQQLLDLHRNVSIHPFPQNSNRFFVASLSILQQSQYLRRFDVLRLQSVAANQNRLHVLSLRSIFQKNLRVEQSRVKRTAVMLVELASQRASTQWLVLILVIPKKH